MARLVARLREVIRFVDDVHPARRWISQDPDDDWVIQCALTAGAECIVTGDRGVLTLGEVEGVRIVSPAHLLRELAPSGPSP